MAAEPPQQFADGAVGRNGVGDRCDGEKGETAIFARAKAGAQVALRYGGILHVIEPVGIDLPDLDQGTRERLAVGGAHVAAHAQRRRGFRTLEDAGAMRQQRLLAGVEGPENRGLGGPRGLAVVDRIDQHGDAEDIGEQDELLAFVAAFLAGAGEELDGREPFGLGQFHVAHEAVQMGDQTGDDAPQPRIRGRRDAVDDLGGDALFGGGGGDGARDGARLGAHAGRSPSKAACSRRRIAGRSIGRGFQ